jgi:hypothetical protein
MVTPHCYPSAGAGAAFIAPIFLGLALHRWRNPITDDLPFARLRRYRFTASARSDPRGRHDDRSYRLGNAARAHIFADTVGDKPKAASSIAVILATLNSTRKKFGDAIFTAMQDFQTARLCPCDNDVTSTWLR